MEVGSREWGKGCVDGLGREYLGGFSWARVRFEKVKQIGLMVFEKR